MPYGGACRSSRAGHERLGSVIYAFVDLYDVRTRLGSRVSPIYRVIADKTRKSENKDARPVFVTVQLCVELAFTVLMRYEWLLF